MGWRWVRIKSHKCLAEGAINFSDYSDFDVFLCTAFEAFGIIIVFDGSFCGYACNFSANVKFQCLGDRILFLTARLTIRLYINWLDECAFSLFSVLRITA